MSSEHRHPELFDFAVDAGVRVIVCTQVSRGAPVLYVSHDEDGDWQLLCGGQHPYGGLDRAQLGCLRCQVAGDASLNGVAGLARGQAVFRHSEDSEWIDEQPDPRWRAIDQPWRCASCGEQHHGLFDLAHSKPAQ